MADSIEQRLIAAIVTRMRTILTTGGFETNIGASVEDSRPNWQEEEGPAISVFEGTVTSEEQTNEAGGMIQVRTVPILVKVFFPSEDDAADNAAFARKATKDIYRAIRSSANWVSGLATETTEKQHGAVYNESFEITAVQVEFEIKYRGAYFNLES